MNILVTGGAGYIGGVTAALLVEAGHSVTVIDDLSMGHRDAVPAKVTFVESDLLDREATIAAVRDGKFDAVMHFGAKIQVGESAKHPELYMRHNLISAINVMEGVREGKVPRMIVSSTAAVYGEPTEIPITEVAPTAPTNAYGASKLAMDQALSFAAAAHGFAAVSLRYFNVAGAFGAQGERHDPETHLIPRLLMTARDPGEPFELYGNDYPTPDGTCIRDYVHVEDLARAHLLALETRVAPGQHETFNLGSGSGFSVQEVLEVAREITGAPIKVVFKPRRAGDPARLVASSAKAREILGWKPAKGDLATMIGDAWSFMQS